MNKIKYLIFTLLMLLCFYLSSISTFAQTNEVQAKAVGSGLVQLWQVVPDGQQSKEGATNSQILNALQCKPNHDLFPLSNGKSEHTTYVNSCYVDDALYLGEDTNYYYIYLAGYEGKVAKNKSHTFKLDLNNDGVSVDYEIQTVAYYIPDSNESALSISDESKDANILEFATDYLDKYSSARNYELDVASSWVVKSVSYYKNESGTLVHYITNNIRSNNYSKFTVGKAPSWMNKDTKYYSYDGVYFYTRWQNIRVNGDGAINQSNPFYNYYNYLPVRSQSNYSSKNLDSFTSSYVGTESKLYETGVYFSNAQSNFGVNGTLQYAMGIHESGWGKSSLSLNKNNLFGMNATDNNPYGNGTSFPTVEAGINYHAERYLSWGYTDPVDDSRFHGSHLGNKGSGMNVKYASDPFWGEKISGWYYTIDKANGYKDYNYYTIGIKTTLDDVSVKSEANTSSKTYYKMMNKKSNISIANYPVIITTTELNFYKIKLDTPLNSNGQIQYSAAYNWNTANGYIPTASVYITNKGNYTESSYLSSIDTPKTNTEVSGMLDISGWYLYGKPISRIELHIDGQKVGDVDRFARMDLSSIYGGYDVSQAGFKTIIDTTKLTNGEHELKIVAVSSDGTTNEQIITVDVQNQVLAYMSHIDKPSSNQKVSGMIEIDGWYVYGKSIDRIELHIDGGKVGDFGRYSRPDVGAVYGGYDISQAGFKTTIDTSSLSNGLHELKIVAVSSDGTTNEQIITVDVQNQVLAYMSHIDKPTLNQTVSGTVEIDGWYAYGKNIERVELHIDGGKVGDFGRYARPDVGLVYGDYDINQAGFITMIDTNRLSNGKHELKIVAVASDGTTDEQLITIDVQNQVLDYLSYIDMPFSNQNVSGMLEINGWYVYGKTIDRIELHIDGGKVGDFGRYSRPDVGLVYGGYDINQAGFKTMIDTKRLSNGEHELKIVAIGSDGTTNEQVVIINVQNQVLSYLSCIDKPFLNQNVSGMLEINGWYIYGKNIERIELHIDGDKVGDFERYARPDVGIVYEGYNVSQAGFKTVIDTNLLSNGTHKLTIVAIGSDGTIHEHIISVVVKN